MSDLLDDVDSDIILTIEYFVANLEVVDTKYIILILLIKQD